MGDEADGPRAGRRGPMRGEQLLEQTIGGVAAEAHLPHHSSKDIDEERVASRAVAGGCGRRARERDAELEFWRGHEGRFYSERRSNSTRARAQSAAI